jgi:eukaryotic-like serine/threonine-protein kinase
MSARPLPKGIGRYKILRLIGRGGMGEVYLATDTALGRRVAIKMLPGPLQTDAKMRSRFLNEARAVAALNHPNIIAIYDMAVTDANDEGFEPSSLYLVLEYVEGEALDQIMEKRRFAVSEVLDLAIQLLEGLKVAHQQRILHRDITPANLMLTPDRRIKILDFGLSKLLLEGARDSSASPRETGDGMIVGTLDYLSPEQALGHPLDERSDLFSFGIVLYQMITGIHPFAGASTTQMVANLMTQEEPPIGDELGVPDSLKMIVKRALRKNASERYGSAVEMLLDLMVGRRELAGHIQTEQAALLPHDAPRAPRTDGSPATPASGGAGDVDIVETRLDPPAPAPAEPDSDVPRRSLLWAAGGGILLAALAMALLLTRC